MKKKFTIIYTIFASAFMLFSLLFLGYNLHKEYKQGTSRTASIFANTVFDLYQELENTDETQRNFSKKISSAVGDFQDYSYYELQKNGQVVFSYPINSSKDKTKSNFTKDFSTMLEIGENKYLLTCNIYLLKPYSIYYYSKIAFFMILAITVLTFILILITGAKEKNKVTKKNDDLDFDNSEDEDFNNDLDDFSTDTDLETELENDIKENVAAVNIEDDIIENYSKHNESLETEVENTEKIEKAEIEPKKHEDENDSKDDFDDIYLEDFDDNMEDILGEEEGKPEQNNEKIISEEVSVKTKKEIENSPTEPEGLFSPVTGLGWESYLLTRLDNELERSVASEMDISLFVIQITDLPRDSERMKNICDYIVEQFQFRDLIFEYKDDCIVAIKNSTTLEDALNFADKIHTEIKKMLEGTDSDCYIGISTRTVRIISGERFLTEAVEALTHAKEDKECSIIAFRADVEKYRRYLETKMEA